MKEWVAAWNKNSWWRTKTERPENVDLWQRLDALCQTHQVEFRWVRGHAGNLENERCDQLALAALRQSNLPVDDGYENKSATEGARPEMQEGETVLQVLDTRRVESAKRFVERPPSLF